MSPHAALSGVRRLRGALDALLAGLVVLAAVHVVLAGERVAVGLAAAAALLVADAVGRARVVVPDDVDAPRGRWWPAGAWVAALLVCWVVLLLVTPTGLWVAFPLMMLEMHVLGPHRGAAAVALTTAVAVADPLLGGTGTLGAVLGPVIGAGVAVGVVVGLEAVVRESQQRQRLVDELVRARDARDDAERERAVATERERLAREIHDTLAQGLASIELLLRGADAAVAAGDDARARAAIDRSRRTARDNLAEARRVVRDLAPADLEARTLVDALGRVAARTVGPRVEVRVSGDPQPLPLPVETALVRVAQSALGNVARHAGATRAAVTVSFLHDAVALDVVDDGCGFVVDEPPGRSASSGAAGEGGGFGLAAMRSRLAELGGTLSVESAPGEGTALAAHVPLDGHEEEAG